MVPWVPNPGNRLTFMSAPPNGSWLPGVASTAEETRRIPVTGLSPLFSTRGLLDDGFILLGIFETRPALQSRLASNLWQSSCLNFPGAEITHICHPASYIPKLKLCGVESNKIREPSLSQCRASVQSCIRAIKTHVWSNCQRRESLRNGLEWWADIFTRQDGIYP